MKWTQRIGNHKDTAAKSLLSLEVFSILFKFNYIFGFGQVIKSPIHQLQFHLVQQQQLPQETSL